MSIFKVKLPFYHPCEVKCGCKMRCQHPYKERSLFQSLSFGFQWFQGRGKCLLKATVTLPASSLITAPHTSRLRIREDHSIHVELRPGRQWSFLVSIVLSHEWSYAEVGSLEFIQQKSSLVQNCLFLSSHVTLTKFIPIVPNTPRHHDHKLHNFFSQPLSKFQVPQETDELGKHPPFGIKQDPVSFYTTSFFTIP